MPQPQVTIVQIPSPPAPPTPPAVPGIASDAAQPAVAQPLPQEFAAFLRTRRDALSSQLNSVERRREEVAEQLRDEDTQASERPGLQERLQVLDQRLIDLEKEIAANSALLANAPARSRSESVAPPIGAERGIRFNGNLVTVFSFMLLMPFAIQMARRWFSPDRAASRREVAELSAMRERMDRMDAAIDAVSIEVERIGEGQRFLTQAMVGGNLPTGVPAFEGVKVAAQSQAELR
jgi:hypothetical protein